jgi:hypothetical protein
MLGSVTYFSESWLVRVFGLKHLLLCLWLLPCLATGGCTGSDEKHEGGLPNQARVFKHQLQPQFTDVTDEVSCDLSVTNDTGRVVHFTDVRTSCSCAEADLAKDTLEPNEETNLRLVIALSSTQGSKRTTCHLATADGGDWVFQVTVPTYRRIQWEDSSFVSFGRCDRGESEVMEVPVLLHSLPGEEPPRIESAECASEQIEVVVGNGEVDELEHGIKRRRCRLVVRLKPHRVAGNHKAAIDIQCVGPDLRESSQVHVTWEILNDYAVRPQRLFFGQVDGGGDAVVREASLYRRDGLPFTINKILLEDGAFRWECPTRSEPRKEHTIVVALDPSKLTKHAWTEMTVDFDSKGSDSISIPLSALRFSGSFSYPAGGQ